jgi:hypothetical protein
VDMRYCSGAWKLNAQREMRVGWCMLAMNMPTHVQCMNALTHFRKTEHSSSPPLLTSYMG